jgi:hypothetical protein
MKKYFTRDHSFSTSVQYIFHHRSNPGQSFPTGYCMPGCSLQKENMIFFSDGYIFFPYQREIIIPTEAITGSGTRDSTSHPALKSPPFVLTAMFFVSHSRFFMSLFSGKYRMNSVCRDSAQCGAGNRSLQASLAGRSRFRTCSRWRSEGGSVLRGGLTSERTRPLSGKVPGPGHLSARDHRTMRTEETR